MIFWIYFSYFVSHSWGIPMMKITLLSHLFKWENLHNWWLTKYFFAPLYIYIKKTHIHSLDTLLGTLASTGLDPFCLQNCLNSSWHRFNKVLETFLRDFGLYWYDNITQLLQICHLLIHDVNLSFHHIPKVLYWIEIWWLWRSFE